MPGQQLVAVLVVAQQEAAVVVAVAAVVEFVAKWLALQCLPLPVQVGLAVSSQAT